MFGGPVRTQGPMFILWGVSAPSRPTTGRRMTQARVSPSMSPQRRSQHGGGSSRLYGISRFMGHVCMWCLIRSHKNLSCKAVHNPNLPLTHEHQRCPDSPPSHVAEDQGSNNLRVPSKSLVTSSQYGHIWSHHQHFKTCSQDSTALGPSQPKRSSRASGACTLGAL